MSDYIIGLTGGIGSGKTTVANMFIALGIEVIDADIVAREVVAPGTPALSKIQQHFGDVIVSAEGHLNRTKLRTIIFQDDAEKTWLNNLLHPLIRVTITNQLATATSQYCILAAPLLLENKLNYLVNRVLVIDVDEQTQITRTMTRDNNNAALVKNIINSQISRADRLAQADDVIDNQKQSLAQVQQQVLTLHQEYLALSI
ncbi:MAG: dephospho-CoA kinase [Thalassotalea sp.]